MINEFPLLKDPVKTVRRDRTGWAIYYSGNFLRYLNEFESNFIDSALAAREAKPEVSDEDLTDLYYKRKNDIGDSFRDAEEELVAVDWFKEGYRYK